MTCVSGLGQVRRGGQSSRIMHDTPVFLNRVCFVLLFAPSPTTPCDTVPSLCACQSSCAASFCAPVEYLRESVCPYVVSVLAADNWDCYDDDVVSACKTEHVLALKGGGDHDMASMLFFRAK